MNNESPTRSYNLFGFAILGFILGFIFIFIGTVIELVHQGSAIDAVNIFQVQTSTPSLWVLYALPLLLAFVFGWAGTRDDQLQSLSSRYRRALRQMSEENKELKAAIEAQEQKNRQTKTSLNALGEATQQQSDDLRRLEIALEDLQAQEVLREILFNLHPMAAVHLTLDLRILECNPAFSQLFGVETEEFIGGFLDDLICPAELSEEAQEFGEMAARGEIVSTFTQRIASGGRMLVVELFELPVKVAGKTQSILALFRDVNSPLEVLDPIELGIGAAEEIPLSADSGEHPPADNGEIDLPPAIPFEDVETELDQDANYRKVFDISSPPQHTELVENQWIPESIFVTDSSNPAPEDFLPDEELWPDEIAETEDVQTAIQAENAPADVQSDDLLADLQAVEDPQDDHADEVLSEIQKADALPDLQAEDLLLDVQPDAALPIMQADDELLDVQPDTALPVMQADDALLDVQPEAVLTEMIDDTTPPDGQPGAVMLEEQADDQLPEMQPEDVLPDLQESEGPPDVQAEAVLTGVQAETETTDDIIDQLSAAGVRSDQDLIDSAAGKSGRERLAEQTGIPEDVLEKSLHRAILKLITNQGEETMRLLELGGITSPAELARKDPVALHAELLEINADQQVCSKPPTSEMVTSWVKAAYAAQLAAGEDDLEIES